MEYLYLSIMVATTQTVAKILTSYYRPKPGGFCKRYFRGINALLEEGCEVHYLAVVQFPIKHQHCFFHRFPWPAGYTDTWLFWGVFHLLAPPILFYLGMRHRITHSFAFGPTYALFMQPLRWIKRIPLSLFLRADTIENHRIKGRSQWLIRLETILEGLAICGVHLYGVSDVLTRTVVERHSLFKPLVSHTLRNDIQCRQHKQDVKPHKPLRMACVGVLEQRKNQALILHSLALLAAYSPRVDIYGSGPDKEKLEQLAQNLDIVQRVHFKGWVMADDIWPQVDLLLMPSLHEGAPNAVLEAMERGIPVLASDIPEHREILSTEALLALEDVNQWVSRLAKILDEPVSSLSKLLDAQCHCAGKLYFDWNAHFLSSVLCQAVDVV